MAIVGTRQTQGHARPVDPGRDMGAIADLIEIAFSGELEHSGNRIVADMRQMATLGPLLTIAERVAPYPSGYVWEEDGRLVGNVTLSPEDLADRRWFISNVAVHPDYQGRGIGRQLMEVALGAIRRQRGRLVALQVRADNEPAQRLYRGLRFHRFDTLVELLRRSPLPLPAWPEVPLRRLKGADWAALLDLARASTPPEVQRVRPLTPQAFRPTLGRRLQAWLDGLLGSRRMERWGREESGVLVAAVSLLGYEDSATGRLDLAVRPGSRGPIEGPLADAGLAALFPWRPRAVAANVSTSHPEALQALLERQFTSLRTLDQLALEL